jgi:hypothetical protein
MPFQLRPGRDFSVFFSESPDSVPGRCVLYCVPAFFTEFLCTLPGP